MLLLIHIVLAVASLASTAYLYVRPSNDKLYGSLGLVAATLASGVGLVIISHAGIAGSCVAGLVYLAVVAVGLTASLRRLARIRLRSR